MFFSYLIRGLAMGFSLLLTIALVKASAMTFGCVTPTQTPSAFTDHVQAGCSQVTSTLSSPAVTFWVGAGCNGTPTPVPLASPVIVFQGGQPLKHLDGSTVASGCTPFGDGPAGAESGSGNGTAHDDSVCLANAIGKGDVEIKAPATSLGYYYFGPANGSLGIAMPSGRNVRCCTDPAGDCSSTTGNYAPMPGKVAFGNLSTSSSLGYHMFNFLGTDWAAGFGNGGSIYGCQFRGPNYMNTGHIGNPSGLGNTQSNIDIDVGAGVNNIKVMDNDFEGIGGNSGAINFFAYQSTAGATATPIETSSYVGWNVFVDTSTNAVEMVAGTNNRITYNTAIGRNGTVDGSGYAGSTMNQEAVDTSFTGTWSTGNLWDHNLINFTGATGFNADLGGDTCKVSGSQCTLHTQTADYSGNTFQFNYVYAAPTWAAVIEQGNSQASNSYCGGYFIGTILPSVYTHNVCTAGQQCSLHCPTGSNYVAGSNSPCANTGSNAACESNQ